MLLGLLTGGAAAARATVLWNHPQEVLARDNGRGQDILRGAIKPHDQNSGGTLYFRIKVDPLSDTAAKWIQGFEAGFMLVEAGQERLGVGNASGAMAYSALNVPKAPKGFQDLNSATPDPPFAYEYMRAGRARFIVWKIEYVPGRDARVTAWLNPDLSVGATEFNQPTNIVVQFETTACFDEFRLIHRGPGGGWKFSQMLVASSFEDLLIPHFWQQRWFFPVTSLVLLVAVAGTVRLFERRRARAQILHLEQERAVASERARIARDIHDEVGAELAQIGLLADLGLEAAAASGGERFFQIAKRARHLVAVMDEIVWAVNPLNDNLTQLADYLCQMADECLSDSSIRLVKEVPTQLPAIPVRAEVRHDLTLAVKESFANLLKHAQATEARLQLSWNAPDLMISVADNGRGFTPSDPSQGNGLANQRLRLQRIGGSVELVTAAGRGTTTTFRIKLPHPGCPPAIAP